MRNINGYKFHIIPGEKTVIGGTAVDYPGSVASGNPPQPPPTRPWSALKLTLCMKSLKLLSFRVG